MIELRPADERESEAWNAVMDLAAAIPRGWTLIGAQMVALHALEHGRELPRQSLDFDVLVDVRIAAGGTRRVASKLVEAGFALAPDHEGIAHRFRRGGAVIDVLAPDGVGERADLTTVPPCRTVRVAGGSQALRRSRPVEVRLRRRQGSIPRPDLLGATLVKARAVGVSDHPADQRRELAFLLTLLDDPRRVAEELRGGERAWLRRRRELLDPGHPAWRGLEGAEDARLALEALCSAS